MLQFHFLVGQSWSATRTRPCRFTRNMARKFFACPWLPTWRPAKSGHRGSDPVPWRFTEDIEAEVELISWLNLAKYCTSLEVRQLMIILCKRVHLSLHDDFQLVTRRIASWGLKFKQPDGPSLSILAISSVKLQTSSHYNPFLPYHRTNKLCNK